MLAIVRSIARFEFLIDIVGTDGSLQSGHPVGFMVPGQRSPSTASLTRGVGWPEVVRLHRLHMLRRLYYRN
jgi:hypothetical protein